MGWAESPSEAVGRAEDTANRALALDEFNARAHIILGRIYIFHQRYEPARVKIDRAIALNPNDAHALAGRGNIRMWLGETDAAIRDLELWPRAHSDGRVCPGPGLLPERPLGRGNLAGSAQPSADRRREL